jgi:transposase-like protein
LNFEKKSIIYNTMPMTTPEALKVNELYKQLDVLTAENVQLKQASSSTDEHKVILDRLDTLEELINSLLCKCDVGKKK